MVERETTVIQTNPLDKRNHLFDALTNHYNIEELNTLCYKLEINHEEIGNNKSGTGRAIDLLEYAERHNHMQKLIKLVKRERPFLFDPES